MLGALEQRRDLVGQLVPVSVDADELQLQTVGRVQTSFARKSAILVVEVVEFGDVRRQLDFDGGQSRFHLLQVRVSHSR